jgi:hypothetical protein
MPPGFNMNFKKKVNDKSLPDGGNALHPIDRVF